MGRVSGFRDDDNPLPNLGCALVMDSKGHIKQFRGPSPTETNRAITPVMMGSTISRGIWACSGGKVTPTASTISRLRSKAGMPIKFSQNYGGGEYTGPTTMRYGLIRS